MRRAVYLLAIASTLIAGLPLVAEAVVIDVPAVQPTLAAAMLVATAGDTIQLAPGTYQEHGIDLVAGVTVLGDPDDPAQVTLDAVGAGRIFDAFELASAPVLRGLTFTGGSRLVGWIDALGGAVRSRNGALVVADCVFTDNEAVLGAGLGCLATQLTVTNTVFRLNRGLGDFWTAGAGLYVDECAGTVVGCTFDQNSAFADDLPGDAAGMYSEQSQMTVQFCTFTANATGAGGAGFYSYLEDSPVLEDCHFEGNESNFGGAIYLENSNASLLRCTVVGNTAIQAGGLQADAESVVELVDCSFTDNVTTQWGGGGIGAWVADLTLTGCTFADNQAASEGGGLVVRGGTARLEQCILSGNSAGSRGGGIGASLATLEVTSCTLVGNASPGGGVSARDQAAVTIDRTIVAFSSEGAALYTQDTGTIDATCTTLHGNAGGDWIGEWASLLGQDGNADWDPTFCDPETGDYHLARNSPCAEVNNPTCGLVGALPMGCGVVAVPAAAVVPAAARVTGIAPNPFNPRTTITLALPRTMLARVLIIDARGRRVRELLDAELAAGDHAVTWDGRDDRGGEVGSGVYLAVVEGEGQRRARAITLLR